MTWVCTIKLCHVKTGKDSLKLPKEQWACHWCVDKKLFIFSEAEAFPDLHESNSVIPTNIQETGIF